MHKPFRIFITGFLQILRWHPIASMVTIAPLIFTSSSNSGMAVISLDLSSTLRCPRTSSWSQAQAETMWMAAWRELESNDRRRGLPVHGNNTFKRFIQAFACDLAVMHRCGSENATYWHTGVNRIDMELVSDPATPEALCIDFRASVTIFSQLIKHLLQRHVTVSLALKLCFFFAQFSNRGHSPYFRYNLSLICPRLYRKFGTYLRFKN